MSSTAVCETSPSLALIKYWGKQDRSRNIPATGSIAIALAGLATMTRARENEAADRVFIAEREEAPERFAAFFSALRRATGSSMHFEAHSANTFPTAAGLASSSSGFAALALACVRLTGAELGLPAISAVARVGSASAARAVYGGFTLLAAGAEAAHPLFGADHWPELRIVVCVVRSAAKERSSRDAMESSRLTSPFYPAWLASSAQALPEALRALERRDLEQLGEAMRLSYLRMFATIVSADPPTLYWLPASVAIINECDSMRRDGLGVWETMDAGPQVKLLCLAAEAERVRDRIERLGLGVETIECRVGGAPVCRLEEER